jgi:voltage-gated potassium channel
MPDSEAAAAPEKAGDEINLGQIVILILSVYVLIVFAVETLVPLSPATLQMLDGVDFIVCVCFIWDFFFRLWRAPSKLGFLKWGWVDLISSIPVLPVFYQMRWLRIIRLLRILRAFRSTKILFHALYRHRARTGLVSIVLMSMLVSVFAAMAELNLETAPNSNIKTSEDALWWAFSTITTNSCEKYPVTEGGRIVALFLMAAGVCLFGTIAAYIATVFLEPLQKTEESELKELLRQMRLLQEKVEALQSFRGGNGRSVLPRDGARGPALEEGDPY